MKKMYIAARYKGLENKPDVENFCKIVKEAGFEDFCFIRDIENYGHAFDTVQEVFFAASEELKKCDIFIMDLSDYPTGGRLIEAGMAHALNIPVISTIKRGVKYKESIMAISTEIIEYDNLSDIKENLKKYI